MGCGASKNQLAVVAPVADIPESNAMNISVPCKVEPNQPAKKGNNSFVLIL